MAWHELNAAARRYLLLVYVLGAVLTPLCLLATANSFERDWFLLTVAALAVAPINVRLPKVSRIISMGDVLTILALIEFGPGPALITYWCQLLVGGGDGFRLDRGH